MRRENSTAIQTVLKSIDEGKTMSDADGMIKVPSVSVVLSVCYFNTLILSL